MLRYITRVEFVFMPTFRVRVSLRVFRRAQTTCFNVLLHATAVGFSSLCNMFTFVFLQIPDVF